MSDKAALQNSVKLNEGEKKRKHEHENRGRTGPAKSSEDLEKEERRGVSGQRRAYREHLQMQMSDEQRRR